MKQLILTIVLLLPFSASLFAADPVLNGQSSPAYDSERVIQSFNKTVHGGIQHVVAKSADDTQQISLVQDYLQRLTNEFRKGGFSETERLHGADTPGLAQLKTAKTDEIRYEYKALSNGAQIHYSSENPNYVQALHEWIDVQVRDHGNAVVPEHQQHHQLPAE